jgi:hypothetical protein
MDDWLWCFLGWLCVCLCTAKAVFGCWCLIELRRKWRAVPELWSIDWLDIVFRVKRDLNVTLVASDFEGRPSEDRVALTAGELSRLVVTKLRDAGKEPSPDGWERMTGLLSEALNINPDRITPESRLYADLGMFYGIE